MRILLADGDIARIASIEVMLGREGFNVYSTDLGDEAVELAKMYDYDLILLADVMGAQIVLQQLRTAKVRIPVLRLSCMGNAALALDAGADDYVVSPPDPLELIARIHAIVRRTRGHAASLVTVGSLEVNLTTKTVSVAGKPVHLTGKEYQMLELLALRKGSLITKEMFLNHLYGGMDEPEIKIIDVFICKLRKKLDAASEGVGFVETVWGRGYLLRDPLQEAGGGASFAPEMADLMDNPPIHVTRRTSQEAEAVNAKKRFGHPEATLVPAAGQK